MWREHTRTANSPILIHFLNLNVAHCVVVENVGWVSDSCFVVYGLGVFTGFIF